MPDLTSRLIVELVDRVSGNAGKAAKGVKGVADELKKLDGLGKKFADTRDLFKGYTAGSANMRKAQKDIEDISRKLREARQEFQRLSSYKGTRGGPWAQLTAEAKKNVTDLERQKAKAIAIARSTSSAFREQGAAIRGAFSNLGVKNLEGFISAERRLKTAVEQTTTALKNQHTAAGGGGWTQRYGQPIGPQRPGGKKPAGPRWHERAVTAGQAAGAAVGWNVWQGIRDFAGFVVDWDREGNRYQAQTGSSKVDRASAEAFAHSLGGSGKITPMRALEILKEIEKAGYTPEQARSMAGPAVNLAQAGGLDPVTALEFITNGLSQFNLPTGDPKQVRTSSERLADVISYAAAETQANEGDVGTVFKYVGPLADALDLSPEHIAAMFMQQARKGVKGAEAGTAIRDMLVKLIKPTLDGQSVLAENNLKMSEYVTDRSDLDGAGFIAGAERKFGKLKKGTAGVIQKWILDNADATMEEQIAFLAEALEKGTQAKGPQDKKLTADYAGKFVNSSVESLDYDKLMTDLINAGLTPTEIARLFTGKHVARDIPIFQGDGYQRDLQTLNTSARGSSAQKATSMTQGVSGAWDRFISASQTAAIALDKVAEGGSGAAALLDDMAKVMRFIANPTKENAADAFLPKMQKPGDRTGKYWDDRRNSLIPVERGVTALGDWIVRTFNSDTPQVGGALTNINRRIAPGARPAGAVGTVPTYDQLGNVTGSEFIPIGVDTSKADTGIADVTSKLQTLSSTNATPGISVAGLDIAIAGLTKLLQLISQANSTSVAPPGLQGAHSDVGVDAMGNMY